MAGRSRKKTQIASIKKGEQNALPSFNIKEKDELIIKDLGVNKDKKNLSKKKASIKSIAVIVFILILFITVVFTIRFINFNVAEMIWKTSVTRGSDNINNKSIRYYSFEKGLMRISNDGITYIGETGDIKWTISYNMKDPIYEANGNYFAIADRNGYEFFIFDKQGTTGYNTTTSPVQKVSLSEDGIIYVLQSDEENSYINVYRSNGEIIDISIKSTLTGDGTAIDFCTSDDGEELVVAYVCLANNQLFTKASYYNFGEAGQSVNSKRIVGEFVEELSGSFLARAHFFDNINSALLYDGGVMFISTKEPAKPEIISNKTFDKQIRSVSYNKKYLALVFEDNRMIIFDKTGNLLADKTIDFDYENFYLSDDYAIFIYANRVMIYDMRGRMIFDKEMEMDIQYVAKKKSLLFTELLVGLIDGVECIRFY
ncbi:MAG: hypothetical protein J6P02_05060 [Lachnospiraceae bacterium]|nr:hypothetical protein [Lachnospiraceae bacterium]